MTVMAFAASLISSMAWPVALVAILGIFRKPVIRLIGRATQYEGFGQKIAFGRNLAEIESQIAKVADRETATADPGEIAEAGLRISFGKPELVARDAEESPSGTILASWLWLNKMIHDLNPAETDSETDLEYHMPARYFGAAEDLRMLRDKVAYGRHDPTVGEAITYVTACEQLGVAYWHWTQTKDTYRLPRHLPRQR